MRKQTNGNWCQHCVTYAQNSIKYTSSTDVNLKQQQLANSRNNQRVHELNAAGAHELTEGRHPDDRRKAISNPLSQARSAESTQAQTDGCLSVCKSFLHSKARYVA